MNIPEINEIQTSIAPDERKLTEIQYQGAWPHDEDPADYYPVIKAVRVG
ncbi:hypothetical protein [Bacillus atrophaeus]|nr:hypothetical protein [Bacillus atrophaeus]